jgi:hypothetical protein
MSNVLGLSKFFYVYSRLPKIFTFVMEQHIFAFSLIIEGTTEKVLQFKMPLKSMYSKTLTLFNKKCIFEHNREVQANKNLLIDMIFVMKFFSGDLSRAAPYRLMLVLNKDVLFHYIRQQN